MATNGCITGPNCCGGVPQGNQSVEQRGMQVQAQPVCVFPATQPYVCSFTPCYPQVFMDCLHTMWYKDPYNGPMIWKQGEDAWSETELDTCPSALAPLYYSPSEGTYWVKENTGSISVWNAQNKEWVEDNNPPCDLRPVFVDPVSGSFVYYPVCKESELRESVTNPYATQGGGN